MGFSRQEYWSGVPLPSPQLYLDVYLFFFCFFTHKVITFFPVQFPVLFRKLNILSTWYILVHIFPSQTINLSLSSNFLLIIGIWFSQAVSLSGTLVHWYECIDSTRTYHIFVSDLPHIEYNFLVHPCCCQCHHFILFYDWVVFQCIGVPHSLHLSVTGHFGGFYILAIGNSVALKVEVHVSFWMMIFFWTWVQEWDFRIIWYLSV